MRVGWPLRWVSQAMSDSTTDLRKALPELVKRYEGKLEVVESICSGQLPRPVLQLIGKRQYAEARAAIQFKFPERLRVCPLEAVEARRYWVKQLTDESGDFERGHDHATLLAPACLAIGVTPDELEREYREYLPRVDYLYKSPISIELTLVEAAQVYVEEAVFMSAAGRIADALRDHYGVDEPALRYFRVHALVDVEHSAAGLEMLVAVAKTEAQRALVLDTARSALERFPIWADDLR